MNVLALLREQLRAALTALVGQPEEAAALIRRSQDPRFGDYQANCAMPLGKKLNRPPRDVAGDICQRLDVADICHEPEIAGPGFINFRLRNDWLAVQLAQAVGDSRLGIAAAAEPQTIVIDYSAPNVAKPMHVGHIRSTVIGDALYRTFKFLGHRVISDNHVGDWGTQFGMILYGYRNFRDEAAYQADPVTELARLYRLVNQLVTYHDQRAKRPQLVDRIEQLEREVKAVAQSPPAAEGDKAAKKVAKQRKRLEQQLSQAKGELAGLDRQLTAVEEDSHLAALANQHSDIGRQVLAETASLHAGDEERRRLWEEFLPPCLAAIEKIFDRLGVRFDHTLGESFYHDRLPRIVDDLRSKGLAQESEGAVCLFLDGYDTPMIVQKQDGAFLYATTDLATLEYRMATWQPDRILYVVDHRQSLHFEHLFAAVRAWGYEDVELAHVSFGTVLGEDGRPFKTRSGDTVGLESLLDEAVRRAAEKMDETEPSKPDGPRIAEADRAAVAEKIGIAALKYADLVQNRTSDYVFSYDKMLALNGNTATYMQYAYARVQSIFSRGQVDLDALRQSGAEILLVEEAERALALALIQFSEALELTTEDYRPSHLTSYLYELANHYSTFFEQCPVLKATDEATRNSRLLLCDLTARTLKTGLGLLGIDVVERM